jgi:hypothetical protein
MQVTVTFRDWQFEVDRELTAATYDKVSKSGAESCGCNDCKNYITYRDKVFPDDIKALFNDLGIDYRKEVEATHYSVLDNGLHNTGGWFHFKGRIVRGKDYRIPTGNGFSIDLTKTSDNFSIGFAEGNDLTYFTDKNGLVQVEFMTNIPWVIDKALETKQTA